MTDARFDAVIFDLDGTLVNTEHIHQEAWLTVMPAYGIVLEPNDYAARLAGRPGLDIARHHFGFSQDEAIALMDVVRARFWELAPGRIQPLPDLEWLLDRLAGVPLAIATSARKADAERVLATIGWRERFGAVITVDDVVNGKPDPEPFLRAAEGLGADPSRCLAFEDAPNGLRSARTAGMTTIGVAATPEVIAPLADLTISSYRDPRLLALLGESFGWPAGT